ncbi:pleiotropic regulatory protein RsmS [Ferrimonas senticii]|uniref:pleiotropic regulatory protein RsmS n=1 Tax=Ferrimonas senticii TaxID=394566 RepID=UPI000407534D|nr:pleiotropic regulatory protein RsmS [Ferrimonas senticii]
MGDKPESAAVPHALASAPQHVQLAVDLIYLLESNDVDPQVALQALEIVQKDLQRRCDPDNL